MKFSPTTFLGYATAILIVVIVARPLYLYWTVANYDAVTGLVAANSMAVAVIGIMSAIKGHFTADSPPSPKAPDLPPQ